MDQKFNNRFFELAVDLAVIDIKRKYIQKILDLYAKINPDNDYSNVIYTIKFFDGSRERIRTFTKDSWEFYDPEDDAPTLCICKDCQRNIVQEYLYDKFN